MITVNAMGKACPEPVIMTKAALEKGATELEVLVDNAVAASNVTRLLEGQGFQVERRENAGEFRLTGRRDGAAVAAAPVSASCPQGGARLAVLVTGKTLGREDKESDFTWCVHLYSRCERNRHLNCERNQCHHQREE